MDKLPFLWTTTDDGLESIIRAFDNDLYQANLNHYFEETQLVTDGKATERTVEFLLQKMEDME